MNKKLSEVMVACLRFLQDNPGVTYDKVPFSERTLDSLARRGFVRHTLMIPYLTQRGEWWER